MKVHDIVDRIEIQNQIHFCYYDYEMDERIKIPRGKANNKEIRYLYSEDDEIYIEVYMED